MNFRSQTDFKVQLIDVLLHISKNLDQPPKCRIAYISTQAESRPVSLHQKIKMGNHRNCITYRGLRVSDRPQKRVVLAAIAANNQRESKRTVVRYECKQCDVYLCATGLCWQRFHENKDN
jgi:hypothetical protein